MTISYAVTVWNELEEIKRLLPFLLKNKRPEDEVVIRWDNSGPKEVWEYLDSSNEIKLVPAKFKNNFAEWKNQLNSMCTGDYIFQIDADEMITEYLMRLLPQILEVNSEADLIRIPRVNTVKGLTEEHIKKWGWVVDSKGRVNWPDMQWRIYRNDPRIQWHGEVHEKIIGHATHAMLPLEEDFALHHPKTIERQEKQNKYYDTL